MDPVDDEIRQFIARLLSLRNLVLNTSPNLLFPQPRGHRYACEVIGRSLAAAAKSAGCFTHITPHQLRHTFATEMLRAGMSLPALKELLGHKSILMTMRYIDVSQIDLQQQYLQSRQKIARLYIVPKQPLAKTRATQATTSDIHTICASVAAARHMLEMYRRRHADEHLDKKLKRFICRLDRVTKKLSQLDSTPK